MRRYINPTSDVRCVDILHALMVIPRNVTRYPAPLLCADWVKLVADMRAKSLKYRVGHGFVLLQRGIGAVSSALYCYTS